MTKRLNDPLFALCWIRLVLPGIKGSIAECAKAGWGGPNEA